MAIRSSVLCALLAGAAATAGAQEPAGPPILLRVGGGVGRPVRSRVLIAMYVRNDALSALGYDSAQPMVRFRMSMTQRVDRVGDTLAVATDLDSLQAESPALPQLAPMIEAQLETVPRHSVVRMDSLGRILAVDPGGVGGLPGAPALSGGPTPQGSGYVLPAEPVRVGDAWTDSAVVEARAGVVASRSRTEYRLERIEPRGRAGTAVVSLRGSVTTSTGGVEADMPFAGAYRLDIAERQMTGFSVAMAYALDMGTGPMRGRMEITQALEGDTAMTPPPVESPAPTAVPGGVAAPSAPSAPRPAVTIPGDSEPAGVELSPEPARFTVIRLAPSDGRLDALLAEQARRARAAGRRAFAEFDAAWCGPCRALKRHLGDPRMVEAFAGTWIVKLDLDRWQGRLAGTGFEGVNAIPVFFELGDDGRPTGRRIDGGAWGEDVPENMAPPLKAFFRLRRR